MGQIANFPSFWSTVTDSFVLSSEQRPNLGSDSDHDDIPVISLRPFFDALGAELTAGHDWSAMAASLTERSEAPPLRSLVAAIGNACAEWGFFQVVDHEVPPELLNDVKKMVKDFFTLPLEEKRRIGRSFDRHLGYNDSELTKNTRDWKEIFDWAFQGYMEMPETVENDYRSGRYSKTTMKSNNQWPAKPEGLREACEAYTAAVVHLANLLLGLITVSLGLPFNLFHHCFDKENTIRARLNYYPQCPLASMVCGVNSTNLAARGSVARLPMARLPVARHVDSGALTVLAQDDVGGLQVKRKDGQWIAVKPRQDAFVVNVGAIFQVWSNDQYCGVEHRVVVNETKERFSIPMFFDPDIKIDVFPVPQLLDETHPAHYQPYNWGFFRRTRNNGNFKQLGENIQIYHFAI